MITIKDNEKPEIEVCKMKCDKGLAKHLNKFEISLKSLMTLQ